MKKIVFILLFSVFDFYSQCDSINVSTITNYTPSKIDSMYESDGMRNGPDYNDATVYFPVNESANLKSIILVPGFFATQSSVIAWARYLSERGFVSMTIGTNSPLNFPEQRAEALIDAIKTLKLENSRSESPLYNRLDTNSVSVGGWSMGGGGAQLAAAIDSSIKAVIAFAPWLNFLELSDSALNHSSPVLIISGELDNVAPVNDHANLHYQFTPGSTPKLLFEIKDGDHNIPLEPETGNGVVGNLAFTWLQLYLNGNTCYCHFLESDSLDQDSTASKYLTNLDCTPTSINDEKKSSLPVKYSLSQNYPNPFNPSTYIEFSTPKLSSVKLNVYNILGRKMETLIEEELPKGNYKIKFNATSLSSGLYFYRLESSIYSETKKMILIK